MRIPVAHAHDFYLVGQAVFDIGLGVIEAANFHGHLQSRFVGAAVQFAGGFGAKAESHPQPLPRRPGPEPPLAQMGHSGQAWQGAEGGHAISFCGKGSRVTTVQSAGTPQNNRLAWTPMSYSLETTKRNLQVDQCNAISVH